MMKFSPLVLAAVAMIASSASGFVPSSNINRMLSNTKSTQQQQSILFMSDDNVS